MFQRASSVLLCQRRPRTSPQWRHEGNTSTRALRRKELLAQHRPQDGGERQELSDGDGQLRGALSSSTYMHQDLENGRPATAPVPQHGQWQLPSVVPTQEVPPQANLRKWIQHASTWEAAVQVFQQTVTNDITPTPRIFATLASVIMERRAQALSTAEGGGDSLGALLQDASSSERWEVTPQERRDLARYVLREANRASTRAEVAFDAYIGAFAEGPDHALVTLLEASMRRHRTVPSMDALADLASLNVNWMSSLRLMRLAREAHGVVPITEMYERTMQLAVGGGKTSFGTRPWRLALELYDECVASGNSLTTELHTRGLQALWRSGQGTWLSARGHTHPQHVKTVWALATQMMERAHTSRVSGQEGSRLYEAAVQAMVHSGLWEAALSVVSKLELAESDTTSSLLVPTATTLAECVSASLKAGNYFQADMFAELFASYGYQWKTVPAEVLRSLLAMCRVAARDASPALANKVLSNLLPATPHTPVLLDRLVSMECLHLLINSRMPMDAATRWTTALRLVGSYDANLWPTQPTQRKGELTMLFYAVRRIASACTSRDAHIGAAVHTHTIHPLEQQTAAWLRRVFGAQSKELEWWRTSVAHRLHVIPSGMPWQQGLEILNRLVLSPATSQESHNNAPPVVSLRYVPVPLRQLLLAVAVNAWRALDSRTVVAASSTLDDMEETVEEGVTRVPDAAEWMRDAQRVIAFIEDHLYGCNPQRRNTPKPWWLLGYLEMLQARLSFDSGSPIEASKRATAALDAMGRAPLGASRPGASAVVVDAVVALQQSTDRVESMLNDSHTLLRRDALARASPETARLRGEAFCW